MRRSTVLLLAGASLVSLLGLRPLLAQEPFDIPLRINMGGLETRDSKGDVWLGDVDFAAPACGGDPLEIRLDDSGGCNTIQNWEPVNFQPDSLELIGFDPLSSDDQYIFDSIRWDNGDAAPDFRLEIPVPDGQYLVNLFFVEGCCIGRHFKIEIQDEIVDDDVSYLDYDPDFPALGRVGRLSFEGIAVDDGLLRIGLLPCPECPGVTDRNALVTALEVLEDSGCTGEDFGFSCEYEPSSGRVNGSWSPVVGAEGYRVLREDVELLTLPASVTSFTDAAPPIGQAAIRYTLEALDGGVAFDSCRCTAVTRSCPRALDCELDPDDGLVVLSWDGPENVDLSGYEVRANGVILDTIAASATSYEHTPDERQVDYEVRPIVDGGAECRSLICSLEVGTVLLDVPLRINAGGPEVVDSLGRTWLGDQGAGLDPLGIRPVDTGGANTQEAWCTPDPANLISWGFDPTQAPDVDLFRSIRWDDSADIDDFVLELPVPSGDYVVTFYFCESCCDHRHFQIAVEGILLADDVHRAVYADAHHMVGRFVFEDIEVLDDLMTIELLPCFECEHPTGDTDRNPILSALEIVPSDLDPCADGEFRQCPSDLVCTLGPDGTVTGEWTGPLCVEATGYDVLKNGESIASLPGDATSFEDSLDGRVGVYEVRPILPAGASACPGLRCTVVDEEKAFSVPLRINMGGPAAVDSAGLLWYGDPGAGADRLGIRPDDAGGANAIEAWCDTDVMTQWDSLQSFGRDPFDAADLAVFGSIRWDLGDDDGDLFAGELLDPDGGDVDFRIELPVPDGDYDVNLYFTECLDTGRHFQVEIQDELLEEDVSRAIYSPSGRAARTGLLSYDDIEVVDGLLTIILRPCQDPECFGGTDPNPIISALEVLPGEETVARCPRDLVCEVGFDGVVTGRWAAPEGVTLTGYDLWRNGEQIATLPANATDFDDEIEARATIYELVPLADGSLPCPDLRLTCQVVDILEPVFEAPVRINMGGREILDSRGEIWLADPGAGEDRLDIRPDDLGGANAEENWFRAAYRPESVAPLGFVPGHPGDALLFNTIRWDTGVEAPDYRIELPLPDGSYDLHLYFNEGCCPDRHFTLVLQDEVAIEDVSYLDYVPDDPGLGKVGRLEFTAVVVEDGLLRIGLLPCPDPDCPGATDTNAILDAIEVLPAGTGDRELFSRGDADATGVINLTDGIYILNFLFLGGPSPTCPDAADADDSGVVNITDGIYVLNYLFLGGPSPEPPEECGEDPTEDSLGACSFAPCDA